MIILFDEDAENQAGGDDILLFTEEPENEPGGDDILLFRSNDASSLEFIEAAKS